MNGPPDPGTDATGVNATAVANYSSVVQGIAGVIAPITLLTAIAFYFGWARVSAFDAYFGVDPSLIGYSTRDYVLNSLNPLFLPVVVVLTVLLALVLGHGAIKHVLDRGERPAEMRSIANASIWLGLASFAIGALAAFVVIPFHVPYLVGSLFPAAGVLLIVYGVDWRRRLSSYQPLSTGPHLLVGLFVSLCLFWAAGEYAATVGRDQAVSLAAHLDELPAVTLTSRSNPLDLPLGYGLVVRRSAGYEYTGLRLLAAKNGALFLIPVDWKRNDGASVFQVSENGIAVTFRAGSQPAPSSSIRAVSLGVATPIASSSSAPPLASVATSPKSQTIAVGGTATFNITVYNDYRPVLKDVSVSDEESPECNRTFTVLLSTTRKRYTCTKNDVSKGFTNIAIVTAKSSTAGTTMSHARAIVKVQR